MLFFNKTTRGVTAAAISSLALVGTAFAAFQSGYDVRAYCMPYISTPGPFFTCCDGGCGGLHTDATGYNLCMDKCEGWSAS